MKRRSLLVLALIGLALPAGVAHAACFPVKSEVVSLGEKAARFYAERSLLKAIDEQKGSLESSGERQTRVTRSDLACKEYPNLIGADEWRCVGEAKVCSGLMANTKKAPAKTAMRAAKPPRATVAAKPAQPKP